MYNDDNYDVSDLGEDIKLRETLLAEAKTIDMEGDASEVNRILTDLRKKWRRIYYWESAYEDQLMDEFDAVLDQFYGKLRAGYQSNQAMKEALIEKAKDLISMDSLQEATKHANDLMEQWKMIGSSGKEFDDQLWNAFNDARQAFFDRKRQNWEEMQVKFANAREVKEALIEKAKAVADSEDWQAISDHHKALLEEWKAVGSAGKEFEDSLWNTFQENRQKFFDRREVYYQQIREELDQKYEVKKGLVEKAKAIQTSEAYTKENTQAMKELNVLWKQVGSCGKPREDEIWGEFRSVMDAYFDGMKQHNEQKHVQWRQRMQEIRNRKLEMIQTQKRQIKYMQDEMVGLLGQRAIDEMQEDIEDKEDFIKELEDEIADIDKKLAE